jgi:hypothetical protein
MQQQQQQQQQPPTRTQHLLMTPPTQNINNSLNNSMYTPINQQQSHINYCIPSQNPNPQPINNLAPPHGISETSGSINVISSPSLNNPGSIQNQSNLNESNSMNNLGFSYGSPVNNNGSNNNYIPVNYNS